MPIIGSVRFLGRYRMNNRFIEMQLMRQFNVQDIFSAKKWPPELNILLGITLGKGTFRQYS